MTKQEYETLQMKMGADDFLYAIEEYGNGIKDAYFQEMRTELSRVVKSIEGYMDREADRHGLE